MAGKKSKPHHKEKIKEYYKDRHELNMLRKEEKHQKRQDYFARRRARLNLEVPVGVKDALTNATVNYFVSKLGKNNYAELIHEIATKISKEKELPRGRVKQELRQVLPKP